MGTVAHSTLTGADLHEPKGVAAAAANSNLVADGLGSHAWVTPNFAQLYDTAITETNNTSYAQFVKSGGQALTFGQSVIVQATNFGLKWIGAATRVFEVMWGGSMTENQAGVKAVYICPALNGTPLTQYEQIFHVNINEYNPVGGSFFITLSNNDSVELMAYDANAVHVITVNKPFMSMHTIGI